MDILYGIVGEGMGHATRSRVLLEQLLGQGHEIRVVVSNKAYSFLVRTLGHHSNLTIHEIEGFKLHYEADGMKWGSTVLQNALCAPRSVLRNIRVYHQIQREGFRADVVFSDFESWAWLYAMNHQVPLISIDNQQAMTRCHHLHGLETQEDKGSFQMTRTFIRSKMPFAYHYLVSGFYFPPVANRRTTLLPPILREEIIQAKREHGEHVLVYHHSAQEPEFLRALGKIPYSFRIYGCDKPGQWDNLTMCAFDEKQFVEDLRTAKAVVAGGGFSLMCEAVHLHVPMYTIPIAKQAEQLFNARYLEKLGYGVAGSTFDPEAIDAFLKNHRVYERALKHYKPRDNSMLFGCVDELLQLIEQSEPAPTHLQHLAMGKYQGPALPAKWETALLGA